MTNKIQISSSKPEAREIAGFLLASACLTVFILAALVFTVNDSVASVTRSQPISGCPNVVVGQPVPVELKEDGLVKKITAPSINWATESALDQKTPILNCH